LAGGVGGGGNGGTVGDVILGAAVGNTGAFVRPGNGAGTSAGTTLNTGDFILTLDSGAHLDLQIGRTASGIGTAGDTSDRLNVTGTVSLDSDLKLSLLSGTGYTIGGGDVVYLIVNDGADAISGVFDSLNGATTSLIEGATFGFASLTWQITYLADFDGGSFSGGNDLAIQQAIPEPSAAAMLLGGLGLLVCLRRFRSSCRGGFPGR
jgi:hypothetical protein